MATQITSALIETVKKHAEELIGLSAMTPDWDLARRKFDLFFAHLSNPGDSLWSVPTLGKITEVYFSQRDIDKGMSNITLRTVAAMPDHLKNDTKKIFLQTAEVCCIFNASHKINFEGAELPADFEEVKMIPSKTKGISTYARPLPALYKKTSLTFDYWMPKILEWTAEIRSKKLKEWRNEAILQYDSCTDFMRICLLFLSDPKGNPPIAKAEERAAILALLGEEFIWTKKSAKREDILTNSQNIKNGLDQLNEETGIKIPIEAWCRITQESYIKPFLK